MNNVSTVTADLSAHGRAVRRSRVTEEARLVVAVMRAAIVVFNISIIALIMSEENAVATSLWTDTASVLKLVVWVVAGVALKSV